MVFIIIGIVVDLLAIFFGLLYVVFAITFKSPNKKQNNFYNISLGEQYEKEREKMTSLIDKMLEVPFEEVKIKSFDGKILTGRYYHVKDGAPIHIAFHGYRGTSVRDTCGSFQISRLQKHNFLTVNQRAHLNSQGKALSFGINERYDCIKWVEYAIKRFGSDVKILISGISMGASTVLMASELNLPKNVYGIIADCPYSSPKAIIKKVLKEDMHLAPWFFYPFVALSARVYGGFSLNSSSPERAVKKAKVPIMIIHGDVDKFVPLEMSENIVKANPNITLHVFSGAGHGLSYMVDDQKYQEIFQSFVNENLEKK